MVSVCTQQQIPMLCLHDQLSLPLSGQLVLSKALTPNDPVVFHVDHHHNKDPEASWVLLATQSSSEENCCCVRAYQKQACVWECKQSCREDLDSFFATLKSALLTLPCSDSAGSAIYTSIHRVHPMNDACVWCMQPVLMLQMVLHTDVELDETRVDRWGRRRSTRSAPVRRRDELSAY